MEACDGYYGYALGTTDNTKYLVIKQELETKLNVQIYHISSTVQLRNDLDINKTQYDFLLKHKYVDVNNFRYCVMQLPYWMISK